MEDKIKEINDEILERFSKYAKVPKDLLVGIDLGSEDVTIEAGYRIKNDGSVELTHTSIVLKKGRHDHPNETCPRCYSNKHLITYRSKKMDMKWCKRCVDELGLESIKKLEEKVK